MNLSGLGVLGSFRLDGRRALITGSSSGIGMALASALGQAGATLVLNGRDADKLQASADVLRVEGLVAQTSDFDVTDAPAVRGAVAAVEAEQGPIDILVNNAGMQIRNPLPEFDDDDWRRPMRTNPGSVFFVSKAVAQGMISRGRLRAGILQDRVDGKTG